MQRPATIPLRTTVPDTDRSMWPATITRVIAQAIIVTTAIWMLIASMLLTVKNSPGVWVCTQIPKSRIAPTFTSTR